ncbi:GatB/YqeY domain-containing protein [Citroniella saccharovorans]|uniref:GatB/YqeY domain-containing protein n=1 Tax=Citroniella saccharovorans TaxID=2053367 RepID=A0AAW9MZ82_9FIRM|nr:GatB/YqeY domain-containing protein [Citroniella saccharovorans]MEB3430198.1 GatB/YqeY domain-containing protein [Citroniella saccharovorans]
MGFLNDLRKDKMLAMKEKDRLKASVISNIMNGVLLMEKEAKREIQKDEGMKIVKSELKQAKDTLESLPSDHADLIEETKKRIEIIESYLPKQLSEDELKNIIEKIIEDNSLDKSPKSKGLIMKNLMAEHGASVDGKLANKVIDSLING